MIKHIEVKRHWNNPRIQVGLNTDKIYVQTDTESFIRRATELAESGIIKQGLPLDLLKKEFLNVARVKKLRWSVKEKTILDVLENDFDQGVLLTMNNLKEVVRKSITESLEGIIKELKEETIRVVR